ncbi:MAG: hypothetical protein LWW87_04930 [Geobacteraceae bacterium]|nr:hypothetical protein [Geobacteraceae bacterium]
MSEKQQNIDHLVRRKNYITLTENGIIIKRSQGIFYLITYILIIFIVSSILIPALLHPFENTAIFLIVLISITLSINVALKMYPQITSIDFKNKKIIFTGLLGKNKAILYDGLRINVFSHVYFAKGWVTELNISVESKTWCVRRYFSKNNIESKRLSNYIKNNL